MSSDDERTAMISRLDERDLYLFNEGTHRNLGDKLGCHLIEAGTQGATFAVWVPSAQRVAVIGDFNGWDRDADVLASRGDSGIFEGFVAAAQQGDVYKYAITTPAGVTERADPCASCTELPPRTGSVVWDLAYLWDDNEWFERRRDVHAAGAPMSVYEIHLGSWRRDPTRPGELLSYDEIATSLVDYVVEMGFTHVELMPVMEHPFYGSWGYQVTSYFAPSSRYGEPQGLMRLVDALHQAGVGVIFDWVPSHFPTDEFALAHFDGTALYEHHDPRRGMHPDWNTLIFNYSRHEVRSFLISSAEHWIERYHADGLRVDAVASMLYLDYSRRPGEWIPNRFGGREDLDAVDFARQLTDAIREDHPDVDVVAEESTAWPGVTRATADGGLGFGHKWDMGWMHDTLEYFARDPIARSYHHDDLTRRLLWAYSERYVLPLSHDEVVHGKGSLLSKMPGDSWQQFANLRVLLGYQWTQPGKKLLFMGGEIAQRGEWQHEGSLDWMALADPGHAGVQRYVADLNRTYRSLAPLYALDDDPAGFAWVEVDDAASSTLSYLRFSASAGGAVLAVCNFTPVPRHDRQLAVPYAGEWREVLNSDAPTYGGSGIGNLGGVVAARAKSDGRILLTVTMPPLACVIFAYEGE